MRIEVWLKETSQPILYEDATHAYTKGPFYCIYRASDGRVTKYPLDNIWRVIESYQQQERA